MTRPETQLEARQPGRLIHLPHPALADEGGDVVMAEARADVQGHGLY